LLLSELSASARRVALVGLAKNTGKTVALNALLSELETGGRRVGVTSVGRDGEQHDVIDSRIEKPAVRLPAGSLVATTDGLLRASGIPHEVMERTGVRTPLGEVLVARLKGSGALEIAGPSASADVREVSDAMLSLGAEQILIDGAIDRRAASSPDVADGLLMSTGAILSEDIDEVVMRTREAVELVRLTTISPHTANGARLRSFAETAALESEPRSLLVGEDGEPLVLPPRFVLAGEASGIGDLLKKRPDARWLIVAGALPEPFVREVAISARRERRELTLVVSDPTRVFLADRGVEHYRRQGISIDTLHPIELQALTVNPVAPRSHRFDSLQLRALLSDAVPDLPVFDVLGSEYIDSQGGRGAYAN
jgi:hypothetical protein